MCVNIFKYEESLRCMKNWICVIFESSCRKLISCICRLIQLIEILKSLLCWKHSSISISMHKWDDLSFSYIEDKLLKPLQAIHDSFLLFKSQYRRYLCNRVFSKKFIWIPLQSFSITSLCCLAVRFYLFVNCFFCYRNSGSKKTKDFVFLEIPTIAPAPREYIFNNYLLDK